MSIGTCRREKERFITSKAKYRMIGMKLNVKMVIRKKEAVYDISSTIWNH
jgi:hypothetical protein